MQSNLRGSSRRAGLDMAITREEFIRSVAASIFWTDMARSPEDRAPLDRESANALLFSCLFNRGIAWEKAMGSAGTLGVVDEMKKRTGYTDTLSMFSVTPAMIAFDMFPSPESGLPSLHRYRYMADYAHQCAEFLKSEYSGDARNLWKDEPTGAQLLARVMDITGIGSKIGAMFVRICVLSHGIVLWDTYQSMDVSPDRGVSRVMSRLGLVGENPTQQEVINKAREMSPMCACEMEGLFVIHLDFCHASRQECHGNTNEDGGTEREECPLRTACPSAR